MDEYLNTDEGRTSYIKRIEQEQMGGNKLSETQQEAMFTAVEAQMKSFDNGLY